MNARKHRIVALILLSALMILAIPTAASAGAAYTAYNVNSEDAVLFQAVTTGSANQTSWKRQTNGSTKYAEYAAGAHLYLDYDYLVTDNSLGGTFRYDNTQLFSVKKLSAGAPEWYNVQGWHHITLDLCETYEGGVSTLTSVIFVDGVKTYTHIITDGSYHLYTMNGETPAAAANFYIDLYSKDSTATAAAPKTLGYSNYVYGFGTESGYAAHKITYVLNGGSFEKSVDSATNASYENVYNYYNSKTAFASLATPVSEGKIFTGWYADAGLHTKVTAANYADVTDGTDITLYAGWTTSNGVESASVTLSEDLALNFYVNAELGEGEVMTAKFTKGTAVTEAAGQILKVENGVTSLKFSCTDIGPQNIDESVSAEFFVNDTLRFSETYSVLEYLKTVAKDYATVDEKLANLANALISYGFNAADFNGKDLSAYVTALTSADFDTVDPGIKRSGLSAFSNSTVETVEGNKCVKILGHQSKHVTVINDAFAGASVGKTYRVSFRYNLVHSINSDNKKGSWFDVWFGKNTGVAGAARIANVIVPELGTWQTFTFDVVFDNAENVGLAIKNEGLGSDSSVDTEELANVLLIDDVTVTEVPAVAAAPAGEKSVPVNAGDAQIKSANVLFDHQNKIVVKYVSAAPVTAQIDGVDAVSEDLGDGLWQISTEGISALDFDKNFTFTVGTSSLTYSVNAYAIAMKDNAAISALTNAMNAYGIAAEAYVAD